MKIIFKCLIGLSIAFVGTSTWAACVTQPSPDNSIVATSAGDSCTNNISISTTANELAGFGMTDMPLGVAVNSVTLVNSSTGTITTTGNGATGIHSEGEGAVIINNGSITVSGSSSSPYYADGINALGNNSQIINSGSIVVSADGMFGVWFGNSSGEAFNNSGSILASGASGAVGVATGFALTNFVNSGSISAPNIVSGVGVYSNEVESFTNTGSISGGDVDVVSDGLINTFNNAQGGNASSSSTTALTFRGILPTNYNIIISSPTHFGQLSVSSPSGVTTFGIYSGSVLSKGTYSSVLSGITSSNLNNTSGNYNGFTWTLNNSSGSIWDLIVNGASTVDTQSSLVNTANALQPIFALQNTVLANSFAYDCAVFDKNDICISAGGRNTAVSAANGLNNTSGLLIAAYRPHPHYRIGAYADQNLSVNNAGATVNLGNNTPLLGVFGVWNERLDDTGTQIKVSAAYGQKNTTVNRQVVGLSEAGSGSSQLNSQGAQVVAKYGFGISRDVIVSPYAGIRYTQNNMGGYTEGTSATVTAPLTYSALNTNATTALAGVGASYKGIPQTNLFASAGVETDTNTANGSYSATGVTGLTPVNFNANSVKTRATATLGATYDVEKNQRLGVTGIYRQESYQAVSTTTVMATYTVGF